MELKDILNFQNFLIVGLAGVAWTLFIGKISSMCKDIENLEKTVMTPEFKAHCPDDKKFEIVQNLVDHF